MKSKMVIATMAVAMFAVSGQAEMRHNGHDHGHSEIEVTGGNMPSGEIIHIKTNGLVCDFCALSIRKVFLKTGAVEKTDVNLRRKFVTLYLKKGKTLPDKKVKQLMKDSGYAVVSILRYEKEGGK